MKFNRTKETYIFYINLKFHSFEEDFEEDKNVSSFTPDSDS